MVGNANLCGRTVTLAQMFGLHRDPSNWNVSAAQKSLLNYCNLPLEFDNAIFSSNHHAFNPEIRLRLLKLYVKRETLLTVLLR